MNKFLWLQHLFEIFQGSIWYIRWNTRKYILLLIVICWNKVWQHRMFYMSIGMNDVWEIANNTFGKYKQKFSLYKLHIESLYSSHERCVSVCIYVIYLFGPE
jgi:hypothetical protein